MCTLDMCTLCSINCQRHIGPHVNMDDLDTFHCTCELIHRHVLELKALHVDPLVKGQPGRLR